MRWLGATTVIATLVAGCSKPAARRDDVRAERGSIGGPTDSGGSTADAGATAVAGDPADAGATVSLADASAPDAPSVAIIDAPMRWSDKRAALTLAYRRHHSDPAATDLAIEPRVIVLHYTGGGSASATRSYFDNLEIEASRKTLARGGAVNVSAHFVVDRDGTIYRLQPETQFARHCIGLNHVAIGIENVGDEAKYPLTAAQVDANVALVRDLARRFPVTHLLGHHEVMAFREHAYFVERDHTYRNEKGDPGARFMTSVRARVVDLGLGGL